MKLLQQARRTWVEPVTTTVIKSFTPSEWGKLVLGFATAILTHPPDSKIVGFALTEQQSAMFTTNDLQPLLTAAFKGSAMSNLKGWTLEGCVALKGVKSIYIEGDEVRRRLAEDLKQQTSPVFIPPMPTFLPFPTFPQWQSYKCAYDGCTNTVFFQGSRCGTAHHPMATPTITPPPTAAVPPEVDVREQPQQPIPLAHKAAPPVVKEEDKSNRRTRGGGGQKRESSPHPPPPSLLMQQPIPIGERENLIKDFFSLYCDVRPGAKDTLVPAEVWGRFCHWLTVVSRYGFIPMDLQSFKKSFEKIYPDYTKDGVYIGFVIARIPGLPVYPSSKRARN